MKKLSLAKFIIIYQNDFIKSFNEEIKMNTICCKIENENLPKERPTISNITSLVKRIIGEIYNLESAAAENNEYFHNLSKFK